MKPTLVTGSNGRLGKYFKPFLPTGIFPLHQELDITNKEQVFEFIEKTRPKTIIHLAALTRIPTCEQKWQEAWQVNVEGTQNLVDACKKFRVSRFILMSTPCVLDGESDESNDENAIPHPTSWYGITKMCSELIVRQLKNYVIVRSNFVEPKQWEYSEAFTDRFSYYLLSNNLAQAIISIVRKRSLQGIIHVCGDKKMSMYDLAKFLPNGDKIKPTTLKIYYEKNPAAQKLTKNMLLSSKKVGCFKMSVD